MSEGIPVITVLTIQANGAKVGTFQGRNGKYGFEIYSIIREKYRPHITSEPFYESDPVAEEMGKKLLNAIRSIDMAEHRKRITDILGDDAETIGRVVDASKGGR